MYVTTAFCKGNILKNTIIIMSTYQIVELLHFLKNFAAVLHPFSEGKHHETQS